MKTRKQRESDLREELDRVWEIMYSKADKGDFRDAIDRLEWIINNPPKYKVGDTVKVNDRLSAALDKTEYLITHITRGQKISPSRYTNTYMVFDGTTQQRTVEEFEVYIPNA